MSQVPTINGRKRQISDDDDDSLKRSRSIDNESSNSGSNAGCSDFENLSFPSNTSTDLALEFRHVVSNQSSISQMVMRRSASSLADVLARQAQPQQQQLDGSAQPSSQRVFSDGNSDISPEAVTLGMKSRLSKRASVIFEPELLAQVAIQEQGASNQDRGQGYGYFIEMDADEDGMCNSASLRSVDPYSRYHENEGSLAFTAPVAPRGDVDEIQRAELAWAQAADTVDDVLSNFF